MHDIAMHANIHNMQSLINSKENIVAVNHFKSKVEEANVSLDIQFIKLIVFYCNN